MTKTSLNTMTPNPSDPDTWICIEDFCGSARLSDGFRVYPYSVSADWNGRAVIFGGAWSEVPDMPALALPTPEAVNAWAAQYHDIDIWYAGILQHDRESADVQP